MTVNYYGLDEKARILIKNQLQRANLLHLEDKETQILIKECHKMRQAIVYGLERFWGEQLRLESEKKLESAKAKFWADVWDELVSILNMAEVNLPNHQNINTMADQLWDLDRQDQQIALAVLTQLCDALVWWTQRYKFTIGGGNNG